MKYLNFGAIVGASVGIGALLGTGARIGFVVGFVIWAAATFIQSNGD